MHIQRLIEANPAKAWTLLGLGAVVLLAFAVMLWRIARSRRASTQRQRADKARNDTKKVAGKRRAGR